MPMLKAYDPTMGLYIDLAWLVRGDKGDKGDKGDIGLPGSSQTLDSLTDVTAPSNTPVGKLLGTTGVGAWGAVDPPVTGLTQAQADLRYLKLTGGSLSGSLGMTGALSALGVSAGGAKVTAVATPTATTDGANKSYVDGRIWTGTQAGYDAIPAKDPTVLYVVVG